MLSKSCLICSKESLRKRGQTDSENTSGRSFSKISNVNGHNKGDKDNENVQNQLQVVFLLRKLLEIPEDTCCLLLQHFGNPNLWVECCDDCSNLVKKCQTAFEQIRALQKHYDRMRLDIKNTILKSQKTKAVESKCEAIVRSHVITQDVARFIKSSETETHNKKFENSTSNAELGNSWEMSSNFLDEEQPLNGSGLPLIVSSINSIGINRDKEIPVSFAENISDADCFISSSATKNPKAKSFYLETDLDYSSMSTNSFVNPHPFLLKTPVPVLLEKIHGIKTEEENAVALNVDTEGTETTDLHVKTSELQQNLQPDNDFQKLNQICNSRNQTNREAKKPIQILPKNSNEDSSTVNSHSYILPDDNFETHADTRSQVGTSARPNAVDENNLIVTVAKGTTLGKRKKKQFKCDICGEMLKDRHGINRHRMIHTGEKPFVCEICGRSFTVSSNRTRHMRIHTGERPFLCKICGKSFIQKPKYDEHQRLHTGEKPFKCEVCGKSFRVKRVLTTHLQSHT